MKPMDTFLIQSINFRMSSKDVHFVQSELNDHPLTKPHKPFLFFMRKQDIRLALVMMPGSMTSEKRKNQQSFIASKMLYNQFFYNTQSEKYDIHPPSINVCKTFHILYANPKQALRDKTQHLLSLSLKMYANILMFLIKYGNWHIFADGHVFGYIFSFLILVWCTEFTRMLYYLKNTHTLTILASLLFWQSMPYSSPSYLSSQYLYGQKVTKRFNDWTTTTKRPSNRISESGPSNPTSYSDPYEHLSNEVQNNWVTITLNIDQNIERINNRVAIQISVFFDIFISTKM